MLVLLTSACLKIPTTDPSEPPTGETTSVARVVWPGKPPAELYRVGEVRVFDLRQGGTSIGTSWGRYDGPVGDGRHRFSTRIELRRPNPNPGGEAAPPLRSLGEIIVDDRGELVRGFERSPAMELRFERSGDDLVFTTGRERESLGFTDGTAYMAFAALLHEELMLGLRPISEGEVAWRLVSLSGSLPTDWTATVTIPDADTPDAAVLRTSLGEQIYLRAGRIERIEVAADDLEIRIPERPAAWPTWTIDPPKTLTYNPPAGATFTRRELELPGQAGEPQLAGEVLIPRGTGPFAAVLFVSSTGQQDRYGFAGPPPVDLGSHQITDALAEAGFVVLRYDDRGHGASADGPISYTEQLEDIRRGLRTLLVQDEVDPDRIALVGHGEGGWKALQLAGEGRGIRAVALLASPGRPYETILTAQAARAIASVPPELRDEAKKAQDRTLAALRSGKDVPAELAGNAVWIREILAVDPDLLIARADVPLWIAQGDRDFEVDPDSDAANLVRLARKHRRAHALQRYPELDHLFMHEPEVSSPSRYLAGGRNVDPKFLQDLASWLRRQLAPAAKSR